MPNGVGNWLFSAPTNEDIVNRNKSYSIIAGAALQFIDYDIDLSVLIDDKPLRRRRKPFHVAQDKILHKDILIALEEMDNQPGEYYDPIRRELKRLHYEVEYGEAFECLAGQWLPLPFLVATSHWDDGLPRYGYGPTDWCRGYISRLGSKEAALYRLTLVFDPRVEDEPNDLVTEDGANIYHALTSEDVTSNAFFSLTTHSRDNAWFIDSLLWVKEALRKAHSSFKKKNPRRILTRLADDFPDYGYEGNDDGAGVATEYMAVYATVLDGLGLTDCLKPVRVINPGRVKPIEVDLVLDIGNSRLTGVLVETVPQRATNLTDCYPLQVRDLSEPSRLYAEPLDTKVEFAEPYFGPVEWSLASRRHSDSFLWPSTVRLGPEASRLSAGSREEMGPTGMSSPKRYLWDTRQRDLEWHLNNVLERHSSIEEPAVGRGAFLMSINVAGVPLSVINPSQDSGRGQSIPLPGPIKSGYTPEDDISAFEARYSRSSLMMFLLSEIIAQALSSINSPVIRDDREHPDTPRRLASIILTVPTAMPLAEQNIFKTWGRLAVETVWSAMGWEDNFRQEGAKVEAGHKDDFRDNPTVRCDWDEATCTQMVWLYNELHEKFHNNAKELFELLGRKRALRGDEAAKANSSLRIATIDMGGGTTDLSITTYSIHNPGVASPLIKPYQEFRDGFNVAGDDIMRQIILNQFLGKISRAATEAGVLHAEHRMATLFQDVAQMGTVSGDKTRELLRSQFVTQVAVPISLHILKNYEVADLSGDDMEFTVKVGDLLGFGTEEPPEHMARILAYVEKPLREAGWDFFNLAEFTFTVNLQEVDRDADSIVEKIMTDMGEVIKLYDCDILILTGRPSRWPAMMRAPYARLFLPVDRITHMHLYRVGAGYPFVTYGLIEDPKTTVVVGAIICALAEGSLEGITIDTANLVPQPINRFLGMLDGHGQLAADHVWFSDIDVDSGEEVEKEREIDFSAPIPVGFRQCSCARWTTTLLYNLEYKSSEAKKQAVGRLPYTVTIEYVLEESESGEQAPRHSNRMLKRTEGTLKVKSVVDKYGQDLPAKKTLVVRLKTLRNDDGYWLDTGAFDNI